jgi:hypothetical protein
MARRDVSADPTGGRPTMSKDGANPQRPELFVWHDQTRHNGCFTLKIPGLSAFSQYDLFPAVFHGQSSNDRGASRSTCRFMSACSVSRSRLSHHSCRSRQMRTSAQATSARAIAPAKRNAERKDTLLSPGACRKRAAAGLREEDKAGVEISCAADKPALGAQRRDVLTRERNWANPRVACA